jgi:fucose 4-O-acetylase-like acetyltransferase
MNSKPPRQPESRVGFVDIAKGIAISLMVLGHVLGGLTIRGFFREPGPASDIRGWLYTFHMATFMFLSGLFLDASLVKGFSRFLLGRLGRLYYPSVIWGAINILCANLFWQFTNGHMGYRALVGLLYDPTSYSWFLVTLFELSILYSLLRVWAPPAGIFVISGLGYLLILRLDMPVVTHLFWWAIWISLGSFLSHWVRTCAKLPLAVTGASCLVFAAVSASGYRYLASPDARNAIMTAAGIGMVLCLSSVIDRMGILRVARKMLLHAGRRSLEIYLLHSLAWVLARIVLINLLHVTNSTLLLILLVAAGIVMSIAVADCAERLNCSWLFSLNLTRFSKIDQAQEVHA